MLGTTARMGARMALGIGVLALAACGGGGEDAAPPSPGSAPLALTPQTMGAAAQAGIGAGELMLQLGQMALDFTDRFGTTASAISESCPNGGTLALGLSDRDGDGKASAGDRVTAQMRDCGIATLAQVLTGTVVFELSAASSGPEAAVRATFDAGFGVELVAAAGPLTGPTSTLLGTLSVEASRGLVTSTMAVASTTADDLRLVTEQAGGTTTDAFRAIAVRKELAYDQARSIVDLSFRVSSETFRGSFTVTTPEPLRAWLNTYPEVGRIEVRGAGATVLSLTPNFVTASERFELALDVGGDGSIERTESFGWQPATAGYLWWDGRRQVFWTSPGYATQSFSSSAFSFAFEQSAQISAADPLRIQYARVPLDHTMPLFRFVDLGNFSPADGPNLDLAATATRHGALVLVRPERPLRHGRIYQLLLSTNGGATWGGDNVTLKDELGNAVVMPGSPLLLTTPDTMHAVARADTGVLVDAAGADQLSAAASSSARPIRSYRWTQLSGVPLVFDSPDAATTTVRASAVPPATTQPAVVELTITDSAGEVEFTRITLTLLRTATTGRVLYLRGSPGDPIGQGQVTVLSDGDGRLDVSNFLGTAFINARSADFRRSADLTVASSVGSPLSVGAFENAVRANFQSGLVWLDASIDNRQCLTPVGRIDVLEIETDAQGSITKLAVDFEQHCDNLQAPPLFGSLRIDSRIPLRP